MDKVKYAILGFGLFGEGSLLPGFQKAEKSELIAITKRKKTEVENKAEKYDIPYAYAYKERKELLQNDQIIHLSEK